MSCRYLKIEDFCSTGSGGTPSRAKPEYYEGGDIPWIKSGDLKDSKIYEANEYITAAGLENSSAKIVEKDSILIAMYGATVGRLAILGINAATNQAICNIRPDTTIADMKYLYYFLKSKFSYFVENAVGGAQPNISQGLIKSLEVPLPSLDEQKRIADILDKAAGVCQKREQAIKLADDFLRATFLEIFGDPVKNPKGWKKNKIKKGVLDITSGWSATGENIPCKSDEFGVLKISSVTSGIFKPEENKMVDSETILASKKLIFPKKGDLLFSRANTRELVAAICMVHQDYDNLFLPDKLWSIKLDHDLLLPEFFLVLIQNEKIRDLLTKQATGTSGSMLNISKNKFEETEIIFPEINVQKYFLQYFQKDNKFERKVNKK
ncbi:restriction endonuclease subunit S [Escherichia coli]|uniref:restriction endonuclease subunit S n=1 Tax=Escherichia coli TaxID=562 RepID=UPI00289D26BB|nr:restriction endonuclease subunit S [Escherichia coli]